MCFCKNKRRLNRQKKNQVYNDSPGVQCLSTHSCPKTQCLCTSITHPDVQCLSSSFSLGVDCYLHPSAKCSAFVYMFLSTCPVFVYILQSRCLEFDCILQVFAYILLSSCTSLYICMSSSPHAQCVSTPFCPGVHPFVQV